jgi:hypothetical protein
MTDVRSKTRCSGPSDAVHNNDFYVPLVRFFFFFFDSEGGVTSNTTRCVPTTIREGEELGGGERGDLPRAPGVESGFHERSWVQVSGQTPTTRTLIPMQHICCTPSILPSVASLLLCH